MISDPNLPLLEEAAAKLKTFLNEIVFVGGVTLGLLVTDSAGAAIRGTNDVDVVAEIHTYPDYIAFSERLLQAGFTEDTGGEIPCMPMDTPEPHPGRVATGRERAGLHQHLVSKCFGLGTDGHRLLNLVRRSPRLITVKSYLHKDSVVGNAFGTSIPCFSPRHLSGQMLANNKVNTAIASARTGITTDGRGFGLVPIISAGIAGGKKVSASTTVNVRMSGPVLRRCAIATVTNPQ